MKPRPSSSPRPQSPYDDTLLGKHPLAERASADLARMQASLRRRMFGGPAPTLGRFTMLGRLGHGSMGIVHEAHDPDLDRRVAIKVIRPGSAATGERLVREARALARLSHPNVVTIHEVGDLDGEVFLVMELLGGGTLHAWLGTRPHAWREVLDMLLQAGRGLAAAHALGLVHRDFKPDNVLLGDDGRPRVVDFGLICAVEASPSPTDDDRSASPSTAEDRTTASRFSGTPAYMAPEQRQGYATARADQYAFCVVLHEALLGWRPGSPPPGSTTMPRPAVRGRPPAAVLRAIRRGLSSEPSERFESMTELLHALTRAARRRSWAWLALGSSLAVTLGVWTSATAEPGPCAEARGLIETARERRVDDDEASLDARLHDRVEHYLEGATAEIDRVCEDDRSTDPRATAVLACVRRRVLNAQALRDLHDERVLSTAKTLEVARQLPAPHACADPSRLASEPAPPADPELAAAEQDLRDDIDRSSLMRIAGLHARAQSRLQTAIAAAKALPSDVARAEAQLELARLQAIEGNVQDAVATLREAIVTAERAGHSRCRAWIQIELGGQLARLGELDAARDELDRAEATVERLGGPDGLPAKLLEIRGIVAFMTGRYAEAVQRLEHSIELHEADLGPHDFALVGPLNLLGASLAQGGSPEQAIAPFERARDLVLEHHGAEHPLMGRVVNNLGEAALEAGDLPRARTNLGLALTINERNLGPEHPSTVIARTNLARVLLALGEMDEGRRAARRALASAERVHGPSSPELRFVLATVAWARALEGRFDDALAHMARAEALITAAWGEHAVQHLDIGTGWLSVLELAGLDDRLAARRAQLEQLIRAHEATPSRVLTAALREGAH